MWKVGFMQGLGVSRVCTETTSPWAIPAPRGNSSDAFKTELQPTEAQTDRSSEAGRGTQARLQGSGASVLLLCVAAGVFQVLLKTWVLSSFPRTGSKRKLPSGHLSPGTMVIFLIFSFFSSHICSKGFTTWKAEACQGWESRKHR